MQIRARCIHTFGYHGPNPLVFTPRRGIKRSEQPSDRQKPRGRRDRDRRTVYGTRQHGTLKGASNTTSLFVFRVDKGVSEDDIKTYISEENITNTSVQCVSHADARAKPFRVNVNNKDKDKVMSSDFWPDGMACRLFMRKEIMMPIAHRCRETMLTVHDGGFQ